MTDEAGPRTEAGRRLLDHFAPLPQPDAQELHRRSAMGRRVKVEAGILAIEAEAAIPDSRLRAAAQRVVDEAEPDDDPEGQFIDYLVGYEAIEALRAALSPEGRQRPFVGDMVPAIECHDPEHPGGAFCTDTTGLPSCYEPFGVSPEGRQEPDRE